MSRYIPFLIEGVCMDCGEKHDRDSRAWRCWTCHFAVESLRNKAVNAVSRAIKAGEIPPISTQVCADCEKPAYDYDHRDYSKPLVVVPRCRSCNFMRGPAIWRRYAEAA